MKGIINLITVLLIIMVSLEACQKDEVPTVTTTETTNVTRTSATSGGTIVAEGSGTVLERGVCWSIKTTPTISDNLTFDGAGGGVFPSNISELIPATTYFIRAYATNDVGTGYGITMSFTTLPAILPTITTTNVTNISQNTAYCGGTIISDGDGSITSRGVCWNTSQNPTIADNKTTEASGTDIFSSSLTGLIGNTTYYVRAYATNNIGTAYGNEVNFKTSPIIPTLSYTMHVYYIGETSARSGGIVDSDGGGAILARGVCWSLSPNPTPADNKVTITGGVGTFNMILSGLSANTSYYLKAFATNSTGTGYGPEVHFTTSVDFTGITGTVTDIEGTIYSTIGIKDKIWMVENFKTTRYSNGDLIGTTTPANLDIGMEINPKYQWAYDNNETNVQTYGRLYTWYSVTDTRNICPTGWHAAHYYEWSYLYSSLGDPSLSGGKLKETGIAHWVSPNIGATNEFGFNGLPCGYRSSDGIFQAIGYFGGWWSALQNSDRNAWEFDLRNESSSISYNYVDKRIGYAVRCVKDN